MRRWPQFLSSIALGLIALLGLPAPAAAQISWNVGYADGPITAGGIGFADPTVPSGESKSLGQLRRDSVTAALDYLGTVLDGRGTVQLQFNASLNSGSGFLAQFGPNAIVLIDGSFQNGQAYQAARTNQRAFPAPDGSGQFNFGFNYNYAGQNAAPSASNFDMVSIAAHELTHGHGFLNLVNQSGQGLHGQPPGNPDVYGVYDRYLIRGNGVGATSLFNTNITSPGYASFVGSTSTFTNGNDPSTGLFFGGPYAREVFGGPVPLWAPSTFQPGSSIGHDNTTPAGLMNVNITPNTVRRLQPYEISMLLDIGWNVYNWNGTGGNWLDGVSNLASSRWRTDLGIVYDGSSIYNTNSSQAQAPILPPYGQVTSNIVLNFGGSGSSGYTSTNDIGTVRLARLNLNSTSTATNTIAGGTLLFGQDSDGTASALVPKIVQQNSGAFTIASAVQVPNGLTLDGTGTGRATVSGTVSGAGGLTKAGTSTFALTGNNTYSGPTSVAAGTFLVNGQSLPNSGTGTGAVSVAGGTLGGTGRIAGTISATGGRIAPGDVATTGILTAANGVTFTNVATFAARLNGTTPGTGHDQLRVESGNVTLGGAGLSLSLGYTPNPSDVLVVLRNDDALGTTTGQFAGVAAGTPITVGSTTAYVYYNYDATLGLFTGLGNDVVVAFTPVPEPATVLGLGAAGLGFGAVLRRRRALVRC